MDWMKGPIRPMELQSQPEPFDSPGHAFEVKWDGIRYLAFLDGSTRLQSRRLLDKTARYPELGGLHELVKAKEAILDGEVVVMWEGKPSFTRALKRDLQADPRKVAALSHELSASYVAFDLLYLDGEPLVDRPLVERKELLQEIVDPEMTAEHSGKGGRRVLEVPGFIEGRGRDLFAAVEKQGLEGIVAKEKESKYLMGVKSRYWLKIKCRRRQLCVVCGFTKGPRGLGALVLGAFHDGKLLPVGHAGSGITDEEAFLLLRKLEPARIAQHPFSVRPPRYREKEYWVQPELVVEIEFLEWTESLTLRAPVIKGFVDQPPEACLIP